MKLNTLRPNKGARQVRKRLGIGEGSGLGKTSGKGTKGHKARSGYKSKPGFEGGQMPLYRRLPKFGFTSRKKLLGKNVYGIVSIEKLAELDVSEITAQWLIEQGVVGKSTKQVKILGGGELSKKLVVTAHAFSASAKAAIENAGGEARVYSPV
jgi:large subunit ribosomal protein L15